MEQCPYSIHWGAEGRITRCSLGKDHQNHGEPEHQGPSGVFEGQTIHWFPGDRREFTGEYPGRCDTKVSTVQCVLPMYHHGNHAY